MHIVCTYTQRSFLAPQGLVNVGESIIEEPQTESADQQATMVVDSSLEMHLVAAGPPSPREAEPGLESTMKTERLATGSKIPGLALSCSQRIATEIPSHLLVPSQQWLPAKEDTNALDVSGPEDNAPDRLELDRDDILLGMDAGGDAEGGCSVYTRPSSQESEAEVGGVGYDGGDDVLMSPVSDGRNLELIDLLRDDEEEGEGEMGTCGVSSVSSDTPPLLKSRTHTETKVGGDPIINPPSPTHILNWKNEPSCHPPPSPDTHMTTTATHDDSPHDHTSLGSDAVLPSSQDKAHCPFQEEDALLEDFYNTAIGKDSRGDKTGDTPPTSSPRGDETLTMVAMEEGAVDPADVSTDVSADAPPHGKDSEGTQSWTGAKRAGDSLSSTLPKVVPVVQEISARAQCEGVEDLLGLTAVDQLESQVPSESADEALVPSCSPALGL